MNTEFAKGSLISLPNVSEKIMLWWYKKKHLLGLKAPKPTNKTNKKPKPGKTKKINCQNKFLVFKVEIYGKDALLGPLKVTVLFNEHEVSIFSDSNTT